MRFRQSPDENAAMWFIVVGSILFLICLSWWISGNRSYRKGWNDAYASFKPDTSAVVDTSHYDHPEPVDVKPAPPSDNGRERLLLGTIAELQARLDSLKASKPDTAFVDVPIPVEVKTYADSTYRAQVSGYRPSLDWIEVYQRTTTITNYVPEYKYPALIISPALNVEILPRSVFAGAGIVADYWKGRFQISAEVGYGINNILSPPTQNSAIETESKILGSNVGFYGKLQAKYNLIRK